MNTTPLIDNSGHDAGFSLVETLIAFAILAALIGLGANQIAASMRLQQAAHARLSAVNSMTVQRIERREPARLDTLTGDPQVSRSIFTVGRSGTDFFVLCLKPERRHPQVCGIEAIKQAN